MDDPVHFNVIKDSQIFENTFFAEQLIQLGPRVLILTIGAAGCGKSTIAKKISKFYKGGLTILSADEIRFAILDYPNSGIDFDIKIEPDVWKIFERKYNTLIMSKYPILLDGINLGVKDRVRWTIPAIKNGFKIVYLEFINDPFLTLAQNASRSRVVDPMVVVSQLSRLEPPLPYEYDLIGRIEKGKITSFTYEPTF